jgi:iron complex outermembrane receptor protein
MMKKKFVLYLMAVIFPASLFSQSSIRGIVYDATDHYPLPGALVELHDPLQTQLTQSDGRFHFSSLKPKSYTIRVSYLGFETYELQLEALEDIELHIELQTYAFMQDEVVVRSTRLKSSSPATFTTIGKRELSRDNTGVDLPYLLQATPSVVVSSDAGTGIGYTGIRIRGSDVSRINVTLNGIPVNDPESHSVFFVNLPDLASSIDNIQIQRGVGTSSNGAAAFGASINIETTQRTPEAYGKYSGSLGSFNTMKNTINFGTGIGKQGFSLDGKLSKISSDGYIDRAWADLTSYYIAAGWSDARTYIKLLTTKGFETTYQAWNGIPKDSLNTNRTYNPAGEMTDDQEYIIGYYDNQTDNYQQDYYQLHLAHQFSPNSLLTAAAFLTNGQGYYDSWKNNRKFSDYGLPNLIISDVEIKRTDLIQQKWLDNQFYGFHAAWMLEKKNVELTAGTGWNRYEGDHYGYISWARFASDIKPDQPWYVNTGIKTDFNSFIKLHTRLSNNWISYVDLQLRKIHYTMAGTHDDLSLLDQDHHFLFFNPKAGIYRRITDRQGVYLTLAYSQREPNRSVYRDADPGQEITHEKLLNIEAGYKLTHQRLRLETNIYYMGYKDQLVLTGKINNTGAAILTNVPDSYRTGIEASLFYELTPRLKGALQLSLSENKIKNFVEYVDNWNYWDDPEHEPYQYSFESGKTDISFSPAIVGGLQLYYQLSPSIQIGYHSNLVGRQYLDNTSSKERSLDPYHIGKLIFGAELSNKLFKTTTLQLSLNNLFNTAYESNGWVYRYIYNGEPGLMDGYFPQAGFHWMLQLNLGF